MQRCSITALSVLKSGVHATYAHVAVLQGRNENPVLEGDKAHICFKRGLTWRVGWMLSTHSPPQKWRNSVCRTAQSTAAGATRLDPPSSVSSPPITVIPYYFQYSTAGVEAAECHC